VLAVTSFADNQHTGLIFSQTKEESTANSKLCIYNT